MTEQRPVSQLAKELAPCTFPLGYKKNWIVTMNDDGLPIFGKQIQIQPKHSTCTIVHWTSDCLSCPSDLITLQPCPGCNLNINKSSYSKKSVATSSVSCSYSAYLRHSWILPMKKSSIMRSKDVSMGWGWVQIVKDSGFLNSIATYKCGIIHDWPSSLRAEAAAIYAALSASPANSVVYIYTDSQSSIEKAGDNASCDYSSQIDRITSLPCWTFSSSNWSLYSLVCGCLPTAFLETFENLGISRLTAMNVVAAIHNNFINKFHKRILNSRSYDKGLWEHVINITSKLKQSPRPKGWSVNFNSGRVIRYYVSIVASTLVGIY
ncbi:hypothetical protein RhiirB3_455022 [Rhizophagus irregularis]|nr:hypothetical protein RhiirB3_455022 [Rhizophagus irregularis]